MKSAPRIRHCSVTMGIPKVSVSSSSVLSNYYMLNNFISIVHILSSHQTVSQSWMQKPRYQHSLEEGGTAPCCCFHICRQSPAYMISAPMLLRYVVISSHHPALPNTDWCLWQRAIQTTTTTIASKTKFVHTTWAFQGICKWASTSSASTSWWCNGWTWCKSCESCLPFISLPANYPHLLASRQPIVHACMILLKPNTLPPSLNHGSLAWPCTLKKLGMALFYSPCSMIMLTVACILHTMTLNG